MRQSIEVIANNLNSNNDMVEVLEVNGDKSILELQDIIYQDYGFEFNELESLKMYLDHDWVNDNELIIMNTYDLMSMPLHSLLDDYYIYDLVKEINESFGA